MCRDKIRPAACVVPRLVRGIQVSHTGSRGQAAGRRLKSNFAIASLLLLFFPFVTHALPEDSKQPIHITSDKWDYNYKTGVNEYTGHVIMNQGSTHLTADRVTTKSNRQHQIQEAIAYGMNQSAHYWTLTKTGRPEVHAYANIIKYYPLESNVTLEKKVSLKTGENSFQGELIHYNSSDQTVTVPELTESRMVILYKPE